MITEFHPTVEQDLHADANPHKGTAGRGEVKDNTIHPTGPEFIDTVTEGTNPGKDKPNRRTNFLKLRRDLDVGAAMRQRPGDRKEVSDAIVDNRHRFHGMTLAAG